MTAPGRPVGPDEKREMVEILVSIHEQFERARKLVLDFESRGASRETIAHLMGVNPGTVSRYVAACKAEKVAPPLPFKIIADAHMAADVKIANRLAAQPKKRATRPPKSSKPAAGDQTQVEA